jgi:hypothetical protein
MPKGSCLCGDVRYRLDGDYTFVASCHCSMCRKHHGAAFATYVGIPVAGFQWLAGEDKVVVYRSSPGRTRGFCRACGSVVPQGNPKGETMVVPAGNLDDDFDAPPQAHVFVASKAPWYEITDGLPRFDAYPPGYDDPVVNHVERPPETRDAVAGSCLCGTVRFELVGEPLLFVNCHCSRCRRGRSSAHASNLFFLPEQIRWPNGEGSVTAYKFPEAERFGVNFCKTCGSAVPRVVAKIGRVNVPGGSLDSHPGVTPSTHIYVGSKAPWFEISDELPQNEEAAG